MKRHRIGSPHRTRGAVLVVSLIMLAVLTLFVISMLKTSVIELKIGGVPTEEQTQVSSVYTVDTNGMVNMPYINKVRAAGLTPGQLANAIESGYRSAKIFTNPTITIVMQPQARFVNVGGAVKAPTRVPFTEDMTLLASINAAGGFNDFADQKRVRLLRGSEAKVFGALRERQSGVERHARELAAGVRGRLLVANVHREQFVA